MVGPDKFDKRDATEIFTTVFVCVWIGYVTYAFFEMAKTGVDWAETSFASFVSLLVGIFGREIAHVIVGRSSSSRNDNGKG